MRLCFLGDISVDRHYSIPSGLSSRFQTIDVVIANLEGALVSALHVDDLKRSKRPILYNTPDATDLLKTFNVRGACLANNHMFDVPYSIAQTQRLLQNAGIEPFGAGATLGEASKPLVFEHAGTTVKMFAFGWDVIGCRQATVGREGVNPLTASQVFDTIRRLREKDTTSVVIFIMHWNYELEIYPQPAHRQLAHDLIHEGVDAIIGLHPHLASGAELVDGKPIVYSLGNWFLPPRQLGQFILKYPPQAACELALELRLEAQRIQEVYFHWYEFDDDNIVLRYTHTEGWDGDHLRKRTPYAAMSPQEYVDWFRLYRARKRGLPIYRDWRNERENKVKDRFVMLRQAAIQTLVRLRLKGGPRT